MNTKPARNDPNIAPTVLDAYTTPILRPIPRIVAVYRRSARGKAAPMSSVGPAIISDALRNLNITYLPHGAGSSKPTFSDSFAAKDFFQFV